MYEIDDYHEQSDLEREITLEDNIYPKAAAIRGQTDRNIRKVRNTMMKRIRKKLYASLIKRESITAEERDFLNDYVDNV